MQDTNPLYAVIDLGSNSFHMLIARLVADGVQTVDKVKRKVRLASGLNEHNVLSDDAMARGLECLSFFAERLQDIPVENVRVVATATLRIAKNAQEFLQQAERVLNHQVTLLSGEQEAKQIYLGVAHTSSSNEHRLVLDIGGASTEIIAGETFDAKVVNSLNIGCVTFKKRYFANDQLNSSNFDQAIAGAKQAINQILPHYHGLRWQSVLGGSGTMQALGEILTAMQQPAIIEYSFLLELKQQMLACKQLNKLKIKGLRQERKPVFASGLAILIALFECFNIKQMQLSSGAIREGLLYEMLPDMRKVNIRQRTINALSERFHIDQNHAQTIKQQVEQIFAQVAPSWQLARDNSYELLVASSLLHEIGLLLEYKYHQQHGAYILQHADLPGFDQAERLLLVAFVKLYKADIEPELLQQQLVCPVETAQKLLIILRLAIILCRRRRDDVLPPYQCQVSKDTLFLTLPQSWWRDHPLIADELQQENSYLNALDRHLVISTN